MLTIITLTTISNITTTITITAPITAYHDYYDGDDYYYHYEYLLTITAITRTSIVSTSRRLDRIDVATEYPGHTPNESTDL